MLPERLLVPPDARCCPARAARSRWSSRRSSRADGDVSADRWSIPRSSRTRPSSTTRRCRRGSTARRRRPARSRYEPTLRAQVQLHDRVARGPRRGAPPRRRHRRRHRRGARRRRRARAASPASWPHHQDRAGRVDRGADDRVEPQRRARARPGGAAVDPPRRQAARALGAHRRPTPPSAAPRCRRRRARRRCRASSSEMRSAHARRVRRDLARHRQAHGSRRVRRPRARRAGHRALRAGDDGVRALDGAQSPLSRPRHAAHLEGARARRGAAPYARDELATIAARCSQMEAMRGEGRAARAEVGGGAAARAVAWARSSTGIITGASDKGTFVRVLDPAAEGKVVRGDRGLAVGQTRARAPPRRQRRRRASSTSSASPSPSPRTFRARARPSCCATNRAGRTAPRPRTGRRRRSSS